MRRFIRFGLCCALVLAIPASTSAQSRDDRRFLQPNESHIRLSAAEGRLLLRDSEAQESFWQLSQFFAPQLDLSSCSVASCVMVLNASQIDRPKAHGLGDFGLYTPDNFFTDNVTKIANREKVAKSGMTLEQLGKVLETFPVSVNRRYASESSIEQFRMSLRTELARANSFIIVNYLRSSIGQQSGGHISPLGAFNESQDMVLILDTAVYKYPWTWVKVQDLWGAMAREVDTESARSRGYVIVSERTRRP